MGYRYLNNKKIKSISYLRLIELRSILRSGLYFTYPESELILNEINLEIMDRQS
jgi:hypothetical protein